MIVNTGKIYSNSFSSNKVTFGVLGGTGVVVILFSIKQNEAAIVGFLSIIVISTMSVFFKIEREKKSFNASLRQVVVQKPKQCLSKSSHASKLNHEVLIIDGGNSPIEDTLPPLEEVLMSDDIEASPKNSVDSLSDFNSNPDDLI